MKRTYGALKTRESMLTGHQNHHPAGVLTLTDTKAICPQLHDVPHDWSVHTQFGVVLFRRWSFLFLAVFNATPPKRGPDLHRVGCSRILVYLKELLQIHVICREERLTPTPPIVA